MCSARWKRRPEGSTWGDFGADDQLGRLNLITADKVRQAVGEVREGVSFCLSLPLDYPGGSVLNPRRRPPQLSPTQRDGRPNMVYPLRLEDPELTDVVCDDQVLITLQYSTQWDSLAHVGALFDADGDGVEEMVFYNGWRGNVDICGPVDHALGAACNHAYGAHALGIENMAAKAIQGRGVLVDLHRHLGPARQFVGYESLMRVMDADRVEVEPGDMLVLHTGFAELVLGMQRDPDRQRLENSCAVLDGRDERLLQWITDSGIAALCADNYAVEGLPARPAAGRAPALPLHQHCLFKLGVPLGELWHLTELARWLHAHGRGRFLLTAPPLRLPGAVGSPVTPVATV
ncbi:MAG: cyclase family protein [Burkholderiales bacterium]|nr:MAG: cyclase family protein [Burkholderiales bacterium]